jgi:hypothetical protein
VDIGVSEVKKLETFRVSTGTVVDLDRTSILVMHQDIGGIGVLKGKRIETLWISKFWKKS